MEQAYTNDPMQQPLTPKPDNYLVWAILVTICCCLPFGIVAIVYAAKVNGLWEGGMYVAAQRASDDAKKWVLIGAISGFVLNAIYWLWYVLVGAAALLTL